MKIDVSGISLKALRTLLTAEIKSPTHCKNTEAQVELALLLKQIWDKDKDKDEEEVL